MPLRPTMEKIALSHNFHNEKVMRRTYWYYTKVFQSENILFLLSLWDYSRNTGYGKKIEGIYRMFLSEASPTQVNLASTTIDRCRQMFGALHGGGARINNAGELLLEDCAKTIQKLLDLNDSQNKSKVEEHLNFYMNPGRETIRVKANWVDRNIMRRETYFQRTRAARAHINDENQTVLAELEGYFGYRPWLKELQTLG
ncbi:MAG: hypothetical protein AAGD13_11890 [Pseudomonadota bacterium]